MHWWEVTYETSFPYTDKSISVAPDESTLWKNFKKGKILKIKKIEQCLISQNPSG